MKKECVFCKMISGEISPTKLYEDDDVLVILDRRPASPKGGHLLVMPKKHFETMTEIPDNLLAHMAKVIKISGKALLKFGPGFNILQNDGKTAGQFVPHVHFHMIPRFEKDGITIERWKENEYDSDKHKEEICEKLRKLILQATSC